MFIGRCSVSLQLQKQTTIHLHNKSLILKITIMAYVITDDCIACGTCIDECPSGAISEGEKYAIDPNSCVDCGTCADVCPSGAIVAGE